MLPATERSTFHITVFEAEDLASVGEILNGYRCLLGGMARATEALEFNEPWADDLIALYREALDHYGAAHGVQLDAERSSSVQRPATVQSAVECLKNLLPEEEKETLRGMAEADLINLHFGLGLYIRNEFGLHSGNEALRSDVTPRAFDADADQVSSVIIEALWKALRRTNGAPSRNSPPLKEGRDPVSGKP